MVTDFEELVSLCDEELRHREYEYSYYTRITRYWENLRKWLKDQSISEFSETIGNQYCDEKFGTHLMLHCPHISQREEFRAVRMLISYQKNGDFEFRCPKVEYVFTGAIGKVALQYLAYCGNELALSEKTIGNRRLYLYDFCRFMNIKKIEPDDISIEYTEAFFASMNYTLASRHNAALSIRMFLQFAYDTGNCRKNVSVFILPDNYSKSRTLPTTYEEDEIKNLVASVERASAIGKRDYLILLLATEYGLRAGDITRLSFDDIDWDKNEIHITQHKTDVQETFPLLSTVGNAIIDYLKYARPETDVPEIIVSMENVNKGKPLSPPTIHSVVTKYMKRAGIKDWQNKKHGPHAMRHSLATNLLKKNVSLPIISTVMGHQRTETTSVYISLDYDKLKRCVLPMPTIHSSFYLMEDNYEKV